jgi:hypothetical protein
MVGVSQSFPGIVHELVGEPLTHHNNGYYNWLALMRDGKEILGTDYIEFTPEGYISRVVSFTRMADWR